jgi:hypothetical protein
MSKKMTAKTALKILTANDLHSGGVVFATRDNNWSPFISQAHLSNDNETHDKLVSIGNQAVSSQIIVEPFLIDITIENGVPVPVRFREQLRVYGPSVRSEFSKPLIQEVA